MTTTQTIPWAPFSQKHIDYINNAMQSRICVAEGAIRSGKTIDNCIIAAAYLETCRDKIHLASGSTIGNAKLNIGVCNGFGLENLFRGRCKWGKYRDNEALFIYSQTGEKIVVFAGGGKADSYKRILGNSYGLWIATEINEHYDSDDSRESFIKVAFGRQAAALDQLVLWDLNPCNPNHRIYEEYIDSYAKREIDGYLYEHFTLEDNLSIDEKRREQIKAQYDPNSVWYRRDIKGERCVADGLIYQHFADNTNDYLIDDVREWCREHEQRIRYVTIGVDFGGTGSATKFQATAITDKWTVIAFDEEYLKGMIDPDALNGRFSLFVRRVGSEYGKSSTWADSAEQILIRGFQNTVKKDNLPTGVSNAKKMEIHDRIKLTLLLMAQKRLYICRKCEHLIEALCEAVYDSKRFDDTRLDDGTTDIDSLDAFEYSIEPYYEKLLIGPQPSKPLYMPIAR